MPIRRLMPRRWRRRRGGWIKARGAVAGRGASGRRFRGKSGTQIFSVFTKALLSPRKLFTRRASVEMIWYDSNRERDDIMPNGLGAKIFNAIGLVVIVVMLTEPLWGLIPWRL